MLSIDRRRIKQLQVDDRFSARPSSMPATRHYLACVGAAIPPDRSSSPAHEIAHFVEQTLAHVQVRRPVVKGARLLAGTQIEIETIIHFSEMFEDGKHRNHSTDSGQGSRQMHFL